MRTVALLGQESGLEHVRVRQVPSLHAVGTGRTQLEAAAAGAVEQGGEHRRRIEVGNASQSTEPSRAASATTRPSPIAAYSRSGA
jgi:hypothetical protein